MAHSTRARIIARTARYYGELSALGFDLARGEHRHAAERSRDQVNKATFNTTQSGETSSR